MPDGSLAKIKDFSDDGEAEWFGQSEGRRAKTGVSEVAGKIVGRSFPNRTKEYVDQLPHFGALSAPGLISRSQSRSRPASCHRRRIANQHLKMTQRPSFTLIGAKS